MAFLVPAVLFGVALLVVALVSMTSSRKAKKVARAQANPQGPRILVHSINDDRCTGCDACVAVCPTNVLDLVDNKSRVLHFQDCIQCEACMWSCPTEALVMHPEGTQPPPVKQPDIDEFYQTRVPGQYLIGEVAGKPLVKNAANLGRAVVEHMIYTGLRPAGGAGGIVDVAIVGSGPGGLSAAMTCVNKGLSYAVFEKEHIVASTIARYPKGKLIMAEPYDMPNVSFLPVFDSSKEEMIPIWEDLMRRVGIQPRLGEPVEGVQKLPDGSFEVRTGQGAIRAQRVVLSTGLRGKPRTLGVQGENLPKVQSLLEDPDNHRGQAVCVVGGGDSALEAAIALADSGAKVIMSYRGRAFNRAAPKNKKTVESYEAQRRIKIQYQSEVVDFTHDTVTMRVADGTHKRYPNHAAFVLIGADPPIKWLSKLGIEYVERPHMARTGRPDELVRRFAAGAGECPETSVAAAAVIKGQELAQELAERPVEIVSRPKKWLRSATSIFTGSSKLDKPMPLSEFARQSRKRHRGDGRRDQLDARERTRVLRMLRDEGGRLADEDSKLYLVERGQESHYRPDHSLPPEGAGETYNMRPGHQPQVAGGSTRSDASAAYAPTVYPYADETGGPPPQNGQFAADGSPPHGYQPYGGPGPQQPGGPPPFHEQAPYTLPPGELTASPPNSPAVGAGAPGEISPKKAVIVGLAKANAEGPRDRRQPPPALPPEHLPPGPPTGGGFSESGPASYSHSTSAPQFPVERHEEATFLDDFSPAGHDDSQIDERTNQVELSAAEQQVVASSPRRAPFDDEPTRAVDLSSAGVGPETHARLAHEEHEGLEAPQTLSDVDWDLDE